jgi:segregation and condensation protein B
MSELPEEEGRPPETNAAATAADAAPSVQAARDAALDPPAPDLEAGDASVVTGDGGAPEPAEATAASGAPGTESAADTTPPAPDPAEFDAAIRLAEALVFAADKPLTPARLQAALPEGIDAGAVLVALAERYQGRGVGLVEVAGGFAFRTAADLAPRLTKVVEVPRRLPRAAMESLAIIAYHQPCTRGEIEEIRGASLAQSTLESLLELGLIAPRGKREAPGRPTLWGTTPRFLEQFGLRALSDLPRREELVTAETGPALPLPAPADAAGAGTPCSQGSDSRSRPAAVHDRSPPADGSPPPS